MGMCHTNEKFQPELKYHYPIECRKYGLQVGNYSPSVAGFKERYLPLLKFSNLTGMKLSF